LDQEKIEGGYTQEKAEKEYKEFLARYKQSCSGEESMGRMLMPSRTSIAPCRASQWLDRLHEMAEPEMSSRFEDTPEITKNRPYGNGKDYGAFSTR
jgi:hypothetical protein